MPRQMKVPADVRLEKQGRLTGRGMREPVYNWRSLDLAPMTLQFGTAAFVLAGDTMKSGAMMARILGKPTTTDVGAITGSWFEFWLFYVRIGDLPTYAETMRDLISGAGGTAPTANQLLADGYDAIFNTYFADEGETRAALGSRLRWPGSDWLDSATLESALPPEDTVNNDAWEEQWVRYQAMRRAKLTVNTFEEYLAKQGVAVPPQLRHEHDPDFKRPELLHYSREFAYPQPTTAPAGTSLAHSVQWYIQERFTRSRFFAEPGFIVPCFAVRPKALLTAPNGIFYVPFTYIPAETLAQPVEFETDPHASLVEVPGSLYSPSGDTVPGTGNMVVDAKDSLLYGHDHGSGAGVGTVRTLDRRPTAAQVNALPKWSIDSRMVLRIASRIHKDATF